MIVAIIRRNVKLLCSSDSARKSGSDTIAVKTILEVCVVMIFAADMLVLAWDSQLRKKVAHFNMQDLHASTSSESTHLHIYINFPHYLASVLYHLLIIYPVKKKHKKSSPPATGKRPTACRDDGILRAHGGRWHPLCPVHNLGNPKPQQVGIKVQYPIRRCWKLFDLSWL